MSAFAPPLPGDSNTTGAGPSTDQQDPSSNPPSGASPFGGGATAILQAVKQIESGYQMLAQQLPSLAPLAADGITKLRSALPQALGSGQPGQPGPGGPQGPPQPGASGASQGPGMSPPPQSQGQ